jgi:hypothetical protein
MDGKWEDTKKWRQATGIRLQENHFSFVPFAVCQLPVA